MDERDPRILLGHWLENLVHVWIALSCLASKMVRASFHFFGGKCRSLSTWIGGDSLVNVPGLC
jgi:hypothetical protein